MKGSIEDAWTRQASEEAGDGKICFSGLLSPLFSRPRIPEWPILAVFAAHTKAPTAPLLPAILNLLGLAAAAPTGSCGHSQDP